MKDDSDPLNGWHLPDVLDVESGQAKNDVYGKLYHYPRTLFSSFYRRITMHSCHFQLLNLNAKDLPEHLEKDRFARIEVFTSPTCSD